MTPTRPGASRRHFLKVLGATAAGAPLGARLLAAEAALAGRLDELARRAREVTLPQALADRYLLDPSLLYTNHASIGTVPEAVHEAHLEYLRVCESNPWLYMWGDGCARLAQRRQQRRGVGPAPDAPGRSGDVAPVSRRDSGTVH